MPTTERVTITLPAEMLTVIDRLARNRSGFIAEAVERELARRQRKELLRSVANPHPEAAELADARLTDWAENLPDDDDLLVENSIGTAVRWVPGACYGLSGLVEYDEEYEIDAGAPLRHLSGESLRCSLISETVISNVIARELLHLSCAVCTSTNH